MISAIFWLFCSVIWLVAAFDEAPPRTMIILGFISISLKSLEWALESLLEVLKRYNEQRRSEA